MKRTLITTSFAFACLSMSGCVGTILSRTPDGNENVSFLGAYPYAGVVIDFRLASLTRSGQLGDFSGPLPLISIPLDIVIDTVLLPGDLIAWPFGYRKRDMH